MNMTSNLANRLDARRAGHAALARSRNEERDVSSRVAFAVVVFTLFIVLEMLFIFAGPAPQDAEPTHDTQAERSDVTDALPTLDEGWVSKANLSPVQTR